MECICGKIVKRSTVNLFGSFIIYFIERVVSIQVGLSGTPELKFENPANPDEVLTVDFNFLKGKTKKKK